MVVYHGSNSNFQHLKIVKNLVRNQSTITNEGMGIYFSTFKDVAASYGKYIYTLEITDDCICDFHSKNTCQVYIDQIVKDVYNNFSVDFWDYIPSLLNDTIARMKHGDMSISGLGRELYLCLDSTELWYTDGRVSDSKREKIYRYLRNYGKSHLRAYLFPYHIKGVGVLKTVDDDVVRIIDKQRIH